MDKILISHGNGGEENNRLINDIFFKNFQNDILAKAEDSAVIEKNLAFSSDSFTIEPIFFKGGDIGKLSICGTCNDLAMAGAKPEYLSFSIILEEGFEIEKLNKIVESMKIELKKNDALIVTGDTKVVPKGKVDGVFINISGIGKIKKHLSVKNIEIGDVLLLSKSIAEHGASIFAQREEIEIESELQSDCQSLWPIVKELIEENIEIVTLRDATRGGISALFNEWAISTDLSIELIEESINIKNEVQGICELLGLEPHMLANEGTFALAVKPKDAQRALDILKKHDSSASIVGKVTDEYRGKVTLKSSWGSKRFLEMPHGEILPRIC